MLITFFDTGETVPARLGGYYQYIASMLEGVQGRSGGGGAPSRSAGGLGGAAPQEAGGLGGAAPQESSSISISVLLYYTNTNTTHDTLILLMIH